MVKWYSEDIWTDNHDNDFGLVICVRYDNEFNTLDWQIYIAKIAYKNEMYFKLIELSDTMKLSKNRELYEFDCCREIPPKNISWRHYLSKYIIRERVNENGSNSQNKARAVSA